MTISAVLPSAKDHERFTLMVVIPVTQPSSQTVR